MKLVYFLNNSLLKNNLLFLKSFLLAKQSLFIVGNVEIHIRTNKKQL